MQYSNLKIILLIVFCTVFASGKLYSKQTTNKAAKTMVVVIDPGHGGKDPGAVNKGIQEKEIVLAIGLKLGQLINENFSDVKVIYTRNTDVFVPLIDRSRIANRNKADLFISIHANFCGTPSTTGTETFVLGLHSSNENLEVAKKENSVILLEDNYPATYEDFDPNSSESYIMFELVQNAYLDQSLALADDIQRQFRLRTSSPNRGVKQAGFLVLRQSSMPSVLVEAGFLSNMTEAQRLKSPEGQSVIAHSILEAFRKFKHKNSSTGSINERKTVATTKPDSQPTASLPQNQQENKIETKPAVAENKPTEKENKPAIPEKVEKTATEPASPTPEQQTGETYFSVQIGASTTPVEPTAANFKGLKNVRRDKIDKYYRFYVGKEPTIEKIMPSLQQIKTKYPQAFIVSFTDGKRTIINLSPNK